MAQAALITTGAVADHCHVTHKTVQNWIRNGQLTAARTPGGHYRIRAQDFEGFLARHDLPSFTQYQQRGRTKVLIVDDDKAVLKTLVGMVSKIQSCAITTASNGFEAGIELLKLRPDVIVLDLMMPELDGFQVCRTARENPGTSDSTIIVVTGAPSEEVVSKAMQCGADRCLSKPFKLRELKDAIEQSGQSQTAAPARAG